MNLNKIEKLALLSKKGDTNAKEALAEEFKPFILNLAKKSYMHGFEIEDIKNACYKSLFICLNNYDPTRHRFVAYATSSIKNSVITLIRYSSRETKTNGKCALILKEGNIENVLAFDTGFVEDNLVLGDASAKLRKAVDELSYEEQEFLDYVFYKNHTVSQYSSNYSCPEAADMQESVLIKLKEILDSNDYSM